MAIKGGFVVADTHSGTDAAEAAAMREALERQRAEDLAASQGKEDKPLTTHERIDDEFGRDANAWMSIAVQGMAAALSKYAYDNGYDDNWMNTHGDEMQSTLHWLENELMMNADNMFNRMPPAFLASQAGTAQGMGRAYFMDTAEGVNKLIDTAIMRFGSLTGLKLERQKQKPSGSGRGSGRGSAGPTADEIRKQFDIKELSNAVNNMNRSLVLEEHADPTRVARAYVEAIVRTKGETKIDFETYVRDGIEKTGRYESIYRNKPEDLTAEQYMAPYIQSATEVVGGDQASELAIEGARGGHTGQQFGQRLKRTDEVTGSSGFINGLESRLTQLNSIFKG